MKVADVKPYEKNPRKNDEAVKFVAESIKEFGFKVPIVVDADNIIVAGHTRFKAAKKLGLTEVPVIVADDLTDEQIKAFRLADNKVAEKAEWDFDLLSEELDELIDIDMTVFGFDDDVIEEEPEVEEDDFEPELPEEPKAKMGDIYQLGNHRLMCGDSTSTTDIDALMNGVKADLVFTDPPYGMKKENDGVANDNLNFNDLLEFNRQWIPLTFGALKDNGSWYCWGIDEPLMDIYSNILKPMAKNNQITFRNLITWDKGHGQGQLSEEFRMYPTADEKCLFVMMGVQGFNNNSDNYFEGYEPIRTYLNEEMEKCGGSKNWKAALGNGMGGHYFTKSQWVFPTKEAYGKLQAFGLEYAAFKKEYDEIKKEYDEIKKEYDEIKKEWYGTRAYFNNTHDNMNNVWHFDRAGKEERVGHATPKPIALCARAIKSSSREDEVVLDVFGGSGSTMIACEQLNRKCYTMELEPKWVDVIIERWEQHTGQKAVLLNGHNEDVEEAS
jgi:DNA modification methylase